MNELLFLLHTIIITFCTLGALRLGKETLIAFICLQGVLSNLFVTKQIMLFGFDVTCSDVFSVSAIFGLNLLQEYFGKQITRKTIIISFCFLFFYLAMTQIHLNYIPNQFDTMHKHFYSILNLMPRITIASLSVYLFVQLLDSKLYAFFKRVTNGNYLIARNILTLSISQFIDTVLFSFLALYGIVESMLHIIFVSFVIKIIVILCSTPFIAMSKKFIKIKE